jgi:hypothetical protein
MSDITDKLRELMAMGYRFAHPRGDSGHVVAVTGVRTHHDVIDVVQIFGENDANAVRMSASEIDILSPRDVLWRSSGTAASVIDELLHLAEPESTGRFATVTAQSNGCWVPSRPGRSTWLSASA